MTKIDIDIVRPDSSPWANATVAVRLVDAGAGGSVEESVISGTQRVRCDADGHAQIDLTPNADISPAGSFYAFTVDRAVPATVRCIEVPAANIVAGEEVPYSWADDAIQVLVDTPPVYLPAPAVGQEGKVPTVNATGDAYELQTPAAGSGLQLASTTPAALGGAAAVGTGTTAARADHVHAMPDGTGLFSNDWRLYADGAVGDTGFTNGPGSLVPIGWTDVHSLIPALQAAEVIDGALTVRDVSTQIVALIYKDSTLTSYVSTADRFRLGFLFAGFQGGTDASALTDAPDVDTDYRSKVTLIATDDTGSGYIAQMAAARYGGTVHYEFNFGSDVSGSPVIDTYTDLPRDVRGGDILEYEVIRGPGGANNTIRLYFNDEIVDEHTDSSFDPRDFTVFGVQMDSSAASDTSQWRPAQYAAWLTAGGRGELGRLAVQPPAAGSGDLVSTNNLSDLANKATARTNLGVAIDVDVQAHSAELDKLAGTLTAVRTSDGTPVNNSTTLVSDPVLKGSLAANTTYRVEGVLFFTGGSTTPDLKIGWTAPSGASILLAVYGMVTSAPSIPAGLNQGGTLASTSDTAAVGAVTGGGAAVQVRGIVKTAGSSGDSGLKWAQNSASPVDTFVQALSHVTFTPID